MSPVFRGASSRLTSGTSPSSESSAYSKIGQSLGPIPLREFGLQSAFNSTDMVGSSDMDPTRRRSSRRVSLIVSGSQWRDGDGEKKNAGEMQNAASENNTERAAQEKIAMAPAEMGSMEGLWTSNMEIHEFVPEWGLAAGGSKMMVAFSSFTATHAEDVRVVFEVRERVQLFHALIFHPSEI